MIWVKNWEFLIEINTWCRTLVILLFRKKILEELCLYEAKNIITKKCGKLIPLIFHVLLAIKHSFYSFSKIFMGVLRVQILSILWCFSWDIFYGASQSDLQTFLFSFVTFLPPFMQNANPDPPKKSQTLSLIIHNL